MSETKRVEYKDLEMPWSLYRKALEILYQRIKDGEELAYWDDTTIGNKSMHCSWGKCSQQPEQWPDPEMHLWPEQFTERGRVAPKYGQDGQWCPNDRRAFFDAPDDRRRRSGCFYSCAFFSPDGRSEPSRDQVIAHILYLLKTTERD